MCGHTTVDWNNCTRDLCVLSLNVKIGGPGLIAEIDESLFTRRKNNAGRSNNGFLKALAGKRKECFLVGVKHRAAATLIQAIKDNINKGTTIYSDCWRSYKTDELQNAGFNRLTVNHVTR